MKKSTWFTITAAYALLAARPALAQHAHDQATPVHAQGDETQQAAPGTATRQEHKSAKHATARTIDVGVTNAFAPAEIHVKRGEKVKLVFTRTTDRTCATSVHIKDLGVNQELPLNKPITVAIEPKKAGKYRYTCSMDMIAGTLVVD